MKAASESNTANPYQSHAAPGPEYLPALTGYRAVAAWLVYLHHHWLPFGAGNQQFNALFLELHIGVSFFFVLSGFLIAYRYLPVARLSPRWLGRYFQNRFARIYPVFFLLTILTLTVEKDYNPVHWFLNLTLLKGFFNEYKFTGIGPSWSLTVEECFYALAPAVFITIRRRLRPLFFWIAGCLLAGNALVLLSHALPWGSFFETFRFMWVYTFFGRCFEFYCGVLLARWQLQQKSATLHGAPTSSPATTGPLIDQFTRGICTFGGLSGVGAVLLGLHWLREEGSLGLFHPAGILLNNFIHPLAVSLLLIGLLREKTLLRAALSSRVMQWLGRGSYVLYLLHNQVFYHYTAETVEKYLDSPWLNYLITFLLLNTASVSIYWLVEKPLHDWLRPRR